MVVDKRVDLVVVAGVVRGSGDRAISSGHSESGLQIDARVGYGQ